MRRADQRTMSNWLQWRHDKPTKYLRSFRFNLNQWAGWNYGGDRLDLGRQRQRARVFAEQLGDRHGLQRQPATFDDRATRGGPGRVSERAESV